MQLLLIYLIVSRLDFILVVYSIYSPVNYPASIHSIQLVLEFTRKWVNCILRTSNISSLFPMSHQKTTHLFICLDFFCDKSTYI